MEEERERGNERERGKRKRGREEMREGEREEEERSTHWITRTRNRCTQWLVAPPNVHNYNKCVSTSHGSNLWEEWLM